MIIVAPLKTAFKIHHLFGAVVSIEDYGQTEVLRTGMAAQLVLKFDDTDQAKASGPRVDQIASALEFARRFSDSAVLLHCVFGQARSPALALAILAERLGPGREADAVQALLAACSETMPGGLVGPNLQVLRLADQFLGRDGRLMSAWLEIEEGSEALSRFRFLRSLAADADDDEEF